MNKIVIRRPDDWHVHLRRGSTLEAVVSWSATFGRIVVMPNTAPLILTKHDAFLYREEIIHALGGRNMIPLMTLFLNEATDPDDVFLAYQEKIIFACKLYPMGVTTNSASGVRDFQSLYPVLSIMEKQGIPLLIHGESPDSSVDAYDREKVFISSALRDILESFPSLKVVLEHITTADSVRFILENSRFVSVAATVTPHHLVMNRTDMFRGGLRPDLYCIPLPNREENRLALCEAVTSDCPFFFAGTDSAPHSREKKYCSVGCAGIFNAPVAVSVYASVFEEMGLLSRLEAFLSLRGAQFYGLPLNEDFVTLKKQDYTHIPKSIMCSDGQEIQVFDSTWMRPSSSYWVVDPCDSSEKN